MCVGKWGELKLRTSHKVFNKLCMRHIMFCTPSMFDVKMGWETSPGIQSLNPSWNLIPHEQVPVLWAVVPVCSNKRSLSRCHSEDLAQPDFRKFHTWGQGGWDGWMASPMQWRWVWANSGRWWRTGKLVMLQSMGSQKVRHDLVNEQQEQQGHTDRNWQSLNLNPSKVHALGPYIAS